MTISLMRGDLLKQEQVDAIVNTVNCVGVMGKGIALQFKNKWPENFRSYEDACKKGLVRPGKMFIYDSGGLVKPNFIINFPTKDHWREKSKIKYIQDGLIDLLEQIKRLNIRSIALPPLGCGNGGLDWNDVRPLIESAFENCPDVEALLFEPSGAPSPKEMVVRTKKPRMTPGRAAILKLLEIYKELDYGLTKIEIQKLAYFLQQAGEDLKLKFYKHTFGPYSNELRHALNNMEGHYIVGLGDGVAEPDIAPVPTALGEAEAFLASAGNSELQRKVERVTELIDGFQSPYGMELLATVHWVATNAPHTVSFDEVISLIHEWNDRKKAIMTPSHIRTAWNRLHETGFLQG